MSNTFGDDTFTREISNMDKELTAMLASRGTQEGNQANRPTGAGAAFNPNDIERQVKGALAEAMGNTYKDGGASRYNIPNPKEMSVSTFTTPTNASQDARVFARESNLRHPEPLPPNRIDLPRASHEHSQSDEQAFPTPSLVRQEVYEPPSHIPGLNLRDKQQSGLERIGDALSTTGSPRGQMIRESVDLVRNAAASASRQAAAPSIPSPSLAPQSAALYDKPTSNIQRVTDNVMLTVPHVNNKSIASRPGRGDINAPNVNEILPDNERPASRKVSRGVNAYGEGYEDFISFAIKGKDARFGFRYGLNPRLNPILCSVFAFGIVSYVIGIVLLVLPERTTVMFAFGILFCVIATIFVIVSSALTGFWRRVRF